MVVKGRTKQKRAVVRIKGWKPKRAKWVLLKKVRSKKHKFKTRVSLQGVGNRPLKVKPRNQKVRRVPVTPAVTPSDDCGSRLEKSDGTLWTCTFSDEFEGSGLDRTKWMPQTTGYTTGDDTNFACYKDDPANVSVAAGSLKLRLTKGPVEPCPGLKGRATGFSSGSVSTYRLFSQKYGRFEARTRNTAANVSGLHEAFWLWPDDRVVDVSKWPDSGEIDIAETYSSHANLAIPFLHTSWDRILGLIPWELGHLATSNTAWTCRAQRGVWNTYAVEWSAKKIEIFVNGKLCLRNIAGDSAFQEPYIIALTQGIGGDQNRYTAATPLPGTYEVDYVRVWK